MIVVVTIEIRFATLLFLLLLSPVLCTVRSGCIESNLINIGKSVYHPKSVIWICPVSLVLTFPTLIYQIRVIYPSS